jgi:predicted glycosyltransferase
MYCHDTYGLGHIRRTMAIATQLRIPKVNILILTGSPIAGRFSFPDRIDFVRIPGMIKKTNEEYLPLSIKINPSHAMEIRKQIITATAKAFQPHLFIVDKEPLGLKKEVLPILRWFCKCQPQTRTVLGLRDIMDDAETVKKDWKDKGLYSVLDSLYSEIWVYGIQDFYNPIVEYGIPDAISQKIRFTGYIPRKVPTKESVEKFRREIKVKPDDKLVVVTTGGGGDGFSVVDNYLAMLEAEPHPAAFKSILVMGPFMPKEERKKVYRRAKSMKVATYHFFRRMEKLLAAADLVVGMGGYNTLCEVLSQGTPTLIIPRESPRREQLIRAKTFHEHRLVDYIPWVDLSPKLLKNKIYQLLEEPEPHLEAISKFKLTGLEFMRQRIQYFRGNGVCPKMVGRSWQ